MIMTFFDRLKRVLLCGFLSLVCSSVNAEPAAALAWTAGDADLEWGPCPDFIPTGCEIAVLHGDPEKRNTDIFFKVPPDFTVPHHRHTSAERMVLVAGEMLVQYDGQEAIILTPGTYAYGPPQLPHSAICQSEEPCVLFIAFEEPIDAIAIAKD
ncbi:MAG: cupin domain-containing protein [Gammaproteobacteria bacterium]|nr:cupin domain-containing protein [Gammaproteobacteria bacterium]